MIGVGLSVWESAIYGAGARFLIRDEFTDTVAAGDVPGTAATPGPGTRGAGGDPEDKMSIAGGVLAWAKHTLDNANNPWLRYGPITRATGVTLHFRARYTHATGQFHVTLDESSTKPPAGSGQAQLRAQGAATVVRFIAGDLNNTNLAHSWPANEVWAEYAIVLKAAGAILYFLNGATWELVIERSDGTEASLYVKIASIADTAGASAVEFDFIRVTTTPPDGIPVPS